MLAERGQEALVKRVIDGPKRIADELKQLDAWLAENDVAGVEVFHA